MAHPFRSLTRARDAIRALRRAHGGAAAADLPATVRLEGGVYPMGAEGTLELGPQDGHTRWISAAVPGQPAPFLSGTHELSDLSWQPHSGKILMASLPPAVGALPVLHFD